MTRKPKAVGIYNNEIFIANFSYDGNINKGFNVLRPVTKEMLEELRDVDSYKPYCKDLWIEAVRHNNYEGSLEEYAQELIDEADVDNDEEAFPNKDESGLEYLTDNERRDADNFLDTHCGIKVGTWECCGWYEPDIERYHEDGWYSDFKKFDYVFDVQLAAQYYKSLKKK